MCQGKFLAPLFSVPQAPGSSQSNLAAINKKAYNTVGLSEKFSPCRVGFSGTACSGPRPFLLIPSLWAKVWYSCSRQEGRMEKDSSKGTFTSCLLEEDPRTCYRILLCIP